MGLTKSILTVHHYRSEMARTRTLLERSSDAFGEDGGEKSSEEKEPRISDVCRQRAEQVRKLVLEDAIAAGRTREPWEYTLEDLMSITDGIGLDTLVADGESLDVL